VLLRGCLEEKDGSLCLSVSDSGIGIAPDEQERIFSRYYRSSSVATISGAGLGLALVKRIVDLHGGRLSVSSSPGEGACFTVYLPQPRTSPL
jgi:signal transduction histidine kinase